MQRTLGVFIRIQILLGIVWTSLVGSGGHEGSGPLAALLLIQPIHAVCMLIALWPLRKYPERRRLALAAQSIGLIVLTRL